MSGSSFKEAGCSKSSNGDSEDSQFVPERGFYQPSTEETREAYQVMLSIIQNYGEANSHMVNCLAVEEILSVLKNKWMTVSNQKSVIKKSLPDIHDSTYEQLVYCAAHIHDYSEVVQTNISRVSQSDNSAGTSKVGWWSAFKLLQDVIINILGAETKNLSTLALETLWILKNNMLMNHVKYVQIEMLLGKSILPNEFESLELIGDSVHDFNDFMGYGGPSVNNHPSADDRHGSGIFNKDNEKEEEVEQIQDDPASDKGVLELAEMMHLTGLASQHKNKGKHNNDFMADAGPIVNKHPSADDRFDSRIFNKDNEKEDEEVEQVQDDPKSEKGVLEWLELMCLTGLDSQHKSKGKQNEKEEDFNDFMADGGPRVNNHPSVDDRHDSRIFVKDNEKEEDEEVEQVQDAPESDKELLEWLEMMRLTRFDSQHKNNGKDSESVYEERKEMDDHHDSIEEHENLKEPDGGVHEESEKVDDHHGSIDKDEKRNEPDGVHDESEKTDDHPDAAADEHEQYD